MIDMSTSPSQVSVYPSLSSIPSESSTGFPLSTYKTSGLNGDVVLDVLNKYLDEEAASQNLHLLTLYKGLSDRLIYRFFEQVFVRNKSDLTKISFALLFRPYAQAKVRRLTIGYKHPKGHNRDVYNDQSGRRRPLEVEDLLPVSSLIARCSSLQTLVFIGTDVPPYQCRMFRKLAINNITHLEGPLWMVAKSVKNLYRGKESTLFDVPLPPLSWPVLKTLITNVQRGLPSSFIRRALDFRHLPSLERLHITTCDLHDKEARRCLSYLRCPPSTKYALVGFVDRDGCMLPFDTVDLPSIWAHPKLQILTPHVEIEWLRGVSKSWSFLEGYMSMSLLVDELGNRTPSEIERRATERVERVLNTRKDLGVIYGFDLSNWRPEDDRYAFFAF